VILIPEIKFTIANICRFVEERQASGKRFTIVVVAEGIEMPADLEVYHGSERRANARSGSMGNLIGDAIGSITKREVRVTVLGHIQRGGSPSPFDRILSTRFGVAAVDLMSTGDFGRMVCLMNSNVESCEIGDAVGAIKLVDPSGDMVHTARATGVSFGDR
jgi:6-phosphofructokinase